MSRSALGLTVALAVIGSVTACRRDEPRTSTRLLEREHAMAFERAYMARYRMQTRRFDEQLLVRRDSRCRKLEPDPGTQRPWLWECVIAYLPRTGIGTPGEAIYRVAVEPRGCFSATTGDFPPLAYERVLRRRSPNPLAEMRSCP